MPTPAETLDFFTASGHARRNRKTSKGQETCLHGSVWAAFGSIRPFCLRTKATAAPILSCTAALAALATSSTPCALTGSGAVGQRSARALRRAGKPMRRFLRSARRTQTPNAANAAIPAWNAPLWAAQALPCPAAVPRRTRAATAPAAVRTPAATAALVTSIPATDGRPDSTHARATPPNTCPAAHTILSERTSYV